MQVRKGANSTLLYLIENGFLDKKVINRTVCPVILDLLKIDPKTESVNGEFDLQLNAIGIMAKVAPIIGSEMTHEIFFDKFMELTQCEVHNIRKQCATVFPIMCEVLGSDVLEASMLQLYVKLCDDTVWNVRNACAQIIPMISILCSLNLRRKYLVPIMKKFMFDESRWVITSALNSLGEFLATFAQPNIVGLAYNYRLDLFITNAADQDFRQQYQSNMLLYSNQPNSSVIFKNLEYYEKEFEKEFLLPQPAIKSMRSLSIPNATTSNKLSPTASGDGIGGRGIAERKVNIETFLLQMIKASHFNDRMNTSGSGRLSSTTASESDECELFSIQNSSNPTTILKRMSSSSDNTIGDSIAANDDNNNSDDPFIKFMKFNTPFKNNFIHSRVLTPEAIESQFVWHMCSGGASEDDGTMHNYIDMFKGNGGNEDEEDDDDDVDADTDFSDFVKSFVGGTEKNSDEFNNNAEDDFASLPPPPPPPNDDQTVADGNTGDDSFETQLNNLTLRDKLNNNCEQSMTSVDESELEQFNSHQYWYIEPSCIDEIGSVVDNHKKDNNAQQKEDISENQQPTNDLNISFTQDQSTLILNDDDNDSNDSMKVNYNKRNFNADKLQIFNDNLEQPVVVQGMATNGNDNVEVEWNLIEDFVYMKDIDINLCFKCAYNFPAVLLTLGKQFWPLMHQHFLSLCNDLQCSVRVRKTMAKSIYQIALIIGAEQATKDLVAPFVEFFKDVDEIKIEVVKLISSFIKIVDASKHEVIINQLELCLVPPVNAVNWRLREQIGIQIVELNKLGPKIQKENCILYLTGLALRLMMDRYDCVRKIGIDAFVSCCEKIKHKKQLLKFLSFHFASSSRWRERQVYILTVDKLLMHRAIKPELFNNHVLKKLLELASDKIPNIRLCVAKCLSSTVMENPYYNLEFRESKKHIQQQLRSLESDVDRDVRENIFSAISEKEKEKTQTPTDTTPTIEIEDVTTTDDIQIYTKHGLWVSNT
ncbi:unnamed protein product [Diamesa hyperborea]